MKKQIQLASTCLLLIITSCKLDKPDFSNTGGSAATSDSYQPVTKGSYWKYNSVVAGNTATDVQTMTGATATFNSKTYYTCSDVSSALGSGTGFYYHGNDNYAIRSTTVSAGITVEYLYLKDNYDVGKTWTVPITDNGNVNGAPAHAIGKIVEKGLTKTVSGKLFTNVIHTQLLIQYDLGSGFEDIQTQDYYIAKGVGIVETDSSSFGTLLTSSLISDYSIK